MSTVMETLRNDHSNFEQLLQLIEAEIDTFERTEQPDYELLEAAICYFEGYPERVHHPTEDLVFLRLRVRAPDVTEQLGDLDAAHVGEAEVLRLFADLVRRVMAEREIEREIVIQAARHFIEHLRMHMRMEETEFFPAAEKHLLPEDWDELGRRIADESDTLFGPGVPEEFERLRRYILDWLGS